MQRELVDLVEMMSLLYEGTRPIQVVVLPARPEPMHASSGSGSIEKVDYCRVAEAAKPN